MRAHARTPANRSRCRLERLSATIRIGMELHTSQTRADIFREAEIAKF